jgi:hypothetical protein
MYERALRRYEEAFGPSHTSTLGTVGNLGFLYKDQGRLGEGEQTYSGRYEGTRRPSVTSKFSGTGQHLTLYRIWMICM